MLHYILQTIGFLIHFFHTAESNEGKDKQEHGENIFSFPVKFI